ncbi:MAG: ComEC/Rec2 family competence protein, partial [Clostridia bacterium]
MKRPFSTIGFSSFFGAFLAFLLFNQFYFLIIILIFSLIAVALKRKNKTIVFTCLICITMLFTYTYILLSINQETINKYENTAIKIYGYVDEIKTSENGTYSYNFNVESVNSYNKNFNINLYSNDEIEPFKKCFLNVKTFEKDEEKLNLSAYFNQNEYNIKYNENNDFFIRKTIHNLRLNFEKIILSSGNNKYTSVITGSVTGNKDYINQKTINSFAIVGASHILAISGLHLSLIILLISKILDKIKVKTIIKSLILIFMIILLMTFVGFSSSINRAGIMMIIFVVAQMLYKKSDSLNSLGFSVLIIILLNPFSVVDIGFLLSVFATIGIIIIYPLISKRLKRKLKFKNKIINLFLDYFALSLSATIFTTPISAIYFEKFSIIAPVVSVAISLFIPIIVVGGFLIGITGIILKIDFIIQIISFIPKLFTFVTVNIIDAFAKIPFSVIMTNTNILKFEIISFSIFLVLYALIKQNKISLKKIVTSVLCFFTVFLLTVITTSIVKYFNVNLIDISENSTVYYLNYKNTNLLIFDKIDNEIKTKINNYFNKNAINKIDYLIITSSGDNNYNFSSNLKSREININYLIAPNNFMYSE